MSDCIAGQDPIINDNAARSPLIDDVTRRAVLRLVLPGSSIRSHWGKEIDIVKSDSFFTAFDTLATCLRTPLLGPPFATMYRGQEQIPSADYCHEVFSAPTTPPALLLDLDRVATGIADEASVKLNRMELWNSSAAMIANVIGNEFAAEVTVWGFFSSGGNQMFPWHRDHADSLIVQLAGTKEWLLEESRSSPTARSDEISTNARRILLRPGEVMHVPSGFAHSVAATSATSFHVSIAVGSDPD